MQTGQCLQCMLGRPKFYEEQVDPMRMPLGHFSHLHSHIRELFSEILQYRFLFFRYLIIS